MCPFWLISSYPQTSSSITKPEIWQWSNCRVIEKMHCVELQKHCQGATRPMCMSHSLSIKQKLVKIYKSYLLMSVQGPLWPAMISINYCLLFRSPTKNSNKVNCQVTSKDGDSEQHMFNQFVVWAKSSSCLVHMMAIWWDYLVYRKKHENTWFSSAKGDL